MTSKASDASAALARVFTISGGIAVGSSAIPRGPVALDLTSLQYGRSLLDHRELKPGSLRRLCRGEFSRYVAVGAAYFIFFAQHARDNFRGVAYKRRNCDLSGPHDRTP